MVQLYLELRNFSRRHKMIKVSYEVTTVWKDRKRAHHKAGKVVIEHLYADADAKAIKYRVCDMIDVDGTLNDDMVVIAKVEEINE